MKREQSSLKMRSIHRGEKWILVRFIDHIMIIAHVIYSCHNMIIINGQNIIGIHG